MNKYKNRFGKAALIVAVLTSLCGAAAITDGAHATHGATYSAAGCPDGVSWQGTCS
jgi:hypothetical protein